MQAPIIETSGHDLAVLKSAPLPHFLRHGKPVLQMPLFDDSFFESAKQQLTEAQEVLAKQEVLRHLLREETNKAAANLKGMLHITSDDENKATHNALVTLHAEFEAMPHTYENFETHNKLIDFITKAFQFKAAATSAPEDIQTKKELLAEFQSLATTLYGAGTRYATVLAIVMVIATILLGAASVFAAYAVITILGSGLAGFAAMVGSGVSGFGAIASAIGAGIMISNKEDTHVAKAATVAVTSVFENYVHSANYDVGFFGGNKVSDNELMQTPVELDLQRG